MRFMFDRSCPADVRGTTCRIRYPPGAARGSPFDYERARPDRVSGRRAVSRSPGGRAPAPDMLQGRVEEPGPRPEGDPGRGAPSAHRSGGEGEVVAGVAAELVDPHEVGARPQRAGDRVGGGPPGGGGGQDVARVDDAVGVDVADQ